MKETMSPVYLLGPWKIRECSGDKIKFKSLLCLVWSFTCSQCAPAEALILIYHIRSPIQNSVPATPLACSVQKYLQDTFNSRWQWHTMCRDAAPNTSVWNGLSGNSCAWPSRTALPPQVRTLEGILSGEYSLWSKSLHSCISLINE